MTQNSEYPEKDSGSRDEGPKSSLATVIDDFLHQARDIKYSARIFVPAAGQVTQRRIDQVVEDLKAAEALLDSDDEAARIHAIKGIKTAQRALKRFGSSSVPSLIERSLFLSLFAGFDAFVGDLVAAIYRKKPDLFSGLDRTFSLSEALRFESLDSLKNSALDSEIETLRRKSYVEQFAYLENKFGVTLKAFERWPDFVEATQRRNLLTHCGGVVSEQYLLVCRREGYASSSRVGERLALGADYFLRACELVIEVGLKLGQTLWRKVFPNDTEEADKHLVEASYDALVFESWDRAIMICEYASSVKKFSSELKRRMLTVNHAIALKASGSPDKAAVAMSSFDWSASLLEFKLADAILAERYGDAAGVMRRIGRGGEILSEDSYHEWPLFRDFRGSGEFLAAYKDVYGYAFTERLQESANAAAEATERVSPKSMPEDVSEGSSEGREE